MSKKYIFLYNIDSQPDDFELSMVANLKRVMPELIIRPFSIIKGKRCNGASIWVPQEKYLMAWTICNYNLLLGLPFADNNLKVTLDDGLEWYNRHISNDIYIWEYDLESECNDKASNKN